MFFHDAKTVDGKREMCVHLNLESEWKGKIVVIVTNANAKQCEWMHFKTSKKSLANNGIFE